MSQTDFKSEFGETSVDTSAEQGVSSEELSQALVRAMISLIGDDVTRPGLVETPERVTRAWGEIYAGYAYTHEQLADMLKLFDESEHAGGAMDAPVLLSKVAFASMCEHHMLPFVGSMDITYTPRRGALVGLSKVPRVVNLLARKLQVQERLTWEVYSVLSLVADHVYVVVEAQHYCVAHRGHRDPAMTMTTHAP